MIQDVAGKEVFKSVLATYFDAVRFVILTLQTKLLANQQNYHKLITLYKESYLVWEVMLYIPSLNVWN